ncbi:MAG: PQQ-binding-like beta-propeller repeat protein [Planctomycetes bacterium]|nr:PQQ-binding-like beta-propeller repeat protein [Planctomycetota bacterium]
MPAGSLFLRVVAVGVTLALTAVGAFADNWTRFRGSNGTGISTDKNIPVKFNANNVLWKIPVGDGNASPIIWGNRLFLHATTVDGAERSLTCYDVANGKQLWKKTLKGKKVKIRQDSSMASSTPTTDGEAVYVSYWNGKDIIVTAYDFTGKELWHRNLGAFISQHGPGASPVLYKDKLILANDMDSHFDIKTSKKPVTRPSVLFALNKKTGQTAWEKPREAYRACYSAPFFLTGKAGKPEMIVTSTTAITSYDPDTGTPNWNWKWTFSEMPLRTVASSIYVNGVILACSGDGRGDRSMVAVATNGFGKDARPDLLWGNQKEFPYVTCPLALGGHIYIVNDSGFAGCFEPKTGKKNWFERLPGARFYASPVLIDGKIYAASEQGDVYVTATNPKEYQLLAKNALDERIRATPAVADGRLYIRGQFNLYCIGK